MKKSLIAAGAASLAVVAMPVVGVFAATTDDRVVTDTIQITVEDTCSFSTKTAYTPGSGQTAGSYTGGGSASDTTYAATVANGAIAAFSVNDSPKADHIFGVVCNDSDGWQVTASAPLNLTAVPVQNSVNNHVISYVADALPAANTENEGKWNAIVSGTVVPAASTEQAPTGIAESGGVKYIKAAGGVIAKETKSTAASTFTVTYGAYVGLETPVGTYTATTSTGDGDTEAGSNGANTNDGGGTIDYVLAAL